MYLMGCCCLVTKLYLTLLQPHELLSSRLLCPWDFPDKDTEVSCPSTSQGSSDPGSSPHHHRQAGFLPLSHTGSLQASWVILILFPVIVLFIEYFQQLSLSLLECNFVFLLFLHLAVPARRKKRFVWNQS